MKSIITLLVTCTAFGMIHNAYIVQNATEAKQALLQTLFKQVEDSLESLYRNNNVDNESRKSNVTETSHTSENLFSIHKRSHANEQHRWFCNTNTVWTNLGDNVHPRFIKEKVCVRRACVNGHRMCQPYHYQINVMTKLRDGEDVDFYIPPELRNEWKFMPVNITVGCQCGAL